MMNRRAFFAAIFAVPAAASLPQATCKPAAGPSEAEFQSALKFIAGDQWPAQVAAQRRAQGRPCLVFNHMPAAVERLIRARRTTGKEELKAAVVDAVRQLRDPQMLLNYYRSLEAEAELMGPHSRSVCSPGF